MNHHRLSSAELSVLSDRDFMVHKSRIYNKVNQLFLELKQQLQDSSESVSEPDSEVRNFLRVKLSRGENYNGFPWRVLDFPSSIHKGEVFLFRTVLLWGHHFCFHLILTGLYKDRFAPALAIEGSRLQEMGWQLCKLDTPWKWEVEPDTHYQAGELTPEEWKVRVSEMPFVKLSQCLPLEDYELLIPRGRKIWEGLMPVLFGQG